MSDFWLDVKDGLPEAENDEYYGKRYSYPVDAVVNDEVYPRRLRWDYNMLGWVYAELPDGPDPDDYEIGDVSHYMYIRKFP